MSSISVKPNCPSRKQASVRRPLGCQLAFGGSALSLRLEGKCIMSSDLINCLSTRLIQANTIVGAGS